MTSSQLLWSDLSKTATRACHSKAKKLMEESKRGDYSSLNSLIQEVCSKLNMRSGSVWRLDTRILLRAMVEDMVMLGKKEEKRVM